MCMEDVRIGRETQPIQKELALTAASQLLLDDSDKRRAMILCPPISGTASVSMGKAAVAGDGIILVAGTRPVTLTVDEHGAMVTKRWFAIHSAGGVNMTVIESTLEKS